MPPLFLSKCTISWLQLLNTTSELTCFTASSYTFGPFVFWLVELWSQISSQFIALKRSIQSLKSQARYLLWALYKARKRAVDLLNICQPVVLTSRKNYFCDILYPTIKKQNPIKDLVFRVMWLGYHFLVPVQISQSDNGFQNWMDVLPQKCSKIVTSQVSQCR